MLIPLYHPRLVTFFAHISNGDTTRKFCDENSLSREQSTISLEACELALTRATHVFLYAIMYEYKFMQIGALLIQISCATSHAVYFSSIAGLWFLNNVIYINLVLFSRYIYAGTWMFIFFIASD